MLQAMQLLSTSNWILSFTASYRLPMSDVHAALLRPLAQAMHSNAGMSCNMKPKPHLAVGVCKGRSTQALAAAPEVHPQQLPSARQLQVGRHRQRDVRAGYVCADDEVARRLDHLCDACNVAHFVIGQTLAGLGSHIDAVRHCNTSTSPI